MKSLRNDVGSDICIFGSPRIHTDTHTAAVGISRSFEALAIITTQTVISRFLISDIVPGSLPHKPRKHQLITSGRVYVRCAWLIPFPFRSS